MGKQDFEIERIIEKLIEKYEEREKQFNNSMARDENKMQCLKNLAKDCGCAIADLKVSLNDECKFVERISRTQTKIRDEWVAWSAILSSRASKRATEAAITNVKAKWVSISISIIALASTIGLNLCFNWDKIQAIFKK